MMQILPAAVGALRRMVGLVVLVTLATGLFAKDTAHVESPPAQSPPVSIEPVSPSSPVASPRPSSRSELWVDEGLVDPEGDSPRLAMLAYREGIAAGFRWLHGVHARPLDPTDRRVGATWELSRPGSPVTTFSLAVGFRADGRRMVAISAEGRKNVLEFKPPASGDAPHRAAELALDDLSQILPVLSLKEKAAGATAQITALPAFVPGGITAFTGALALLQRPGELPGPAELARAGYALAWQALLDHRLAPAAAPIRAAQALALVAVAARRSSIALPEVEATRWLAHAAATGDFWMLARTPPPASFPDLSLLHEAFRDPRLPAQRPAGWALPLLVASTETALSLDQSSRLTDFYEWSKQPTLPLTAISYLAQSGEFGVLAHTSTYVLASSLQSLTMLDGHGVHLRPEVVAAAKCGLQGLTGRIHRDAMLKVMVDTVVPLARTLMQDAAASADWSERVIEEECADRLLHTLCPVTSMYANYGWSKAITDAYKGMWATADWNHPEIQWQLTDSTVAQAETMERRAQPIGNALRAVTVMPGLPHRTASVSAAERLTPTYLWQALMMQLASYPDRPGVAAQALQVGLELGHLPEAYALLRRLLRDGGPARTPFYGLILSEMPSAMQRELLAQVPPDWREVPGVAHAVASQLVKDGKGQEAVQLLEKALGDSADPTLTSDLVDCLAQVHDLAGAVRVLSPDRRSRLPGLSRSTAELAMANHLLDAGHGTEALDWARLASASAAEWAYTGHALVALSVGQPTEAQESIDKATKHYGEGAESARMSALQHVVATRGAQGWDQLETSLAGIVPIEVDPYAQVLDRARVPMPATSLGARLAFALKVHTLTESNNTPDPAVVMGLLNECRGEDEKAQWCRLRLALSTLPMVARSLTRGGAPGQPRSFTVDEIKGLLDPISNNHFLIVDSLLATMEATGAPKGVLVSTLGKLVPLLDAKDQAFFGALAASPSRLEAWLAVTSPSAKLDICLTQYLLFLWLTDQGGECREMLKALMSHSPGQALEPRPLFMILTILGGSDTAATAWLTDQGIKEGELSRWGWRQDVRGLKGVLAQFQMLRPPGAATNLLAVR